MKQLSDYINRMKRSVILAGVILASITGCKKTLDLKPLDAISDLTLWSNQELVKAYTGNFYAQLTSGFTANAWLIGSITDDGAVPGTSSSARSFSNPTFTASNSPMNSLWTSR